MHDLYAKNVLYEALDAVRKSEMEKPIAPLDEQFIDVYCEPLPDAPPPEQVPHLGMLRRMTERRCMLEPFSSSPGSDAIKGDLRKQFNLHHRLRKDFKDEKLPKPLLWVLSPGRPEDLCKTDLSEFLGCLLDAHFRAAGSVPIGCNCSVYWRFWGAGNTHIVCDLCGPSLPAYTRDVRQSRALGNGMVRHRTLGYNGASAAPLNRYRRGGRRSFLGS